MSMIHNGRAAVVRYDKENKNDEEVLFCNESTRTYHSFTFHHIPCKYGTPVLRIFGFVSMNDVVYLMS